MVASSPSTAAAPTGPATADALLQAQARRVRGHGALCCAWLLLFSLGGFAALKLAGMRLTPALGALGALAPLVGLALLASPVQPARRYTLHLLAATLFLPIGLLFAAASLDLDPMQPRPARLDAQRLFAGAAVTADSDLSGAGIVLMRSGAFADGSEVRLMRFTEADGARQHVAMLAQALHGEPFAMQGRHGVRLRNGVLPDSLMLIERHGADVLELRARDVAGGLARLAWQQVPVPTPDATAASTPRWPFFVAAVLAHGLAFVALIVWGGRWTTRMPAAPGAIAVNAAALRARLVSFAASPRAPFTLVESSDARVIVDVPVGPLRSHRIALALDAARREVGVTERIGVHGDRPRDAAEASLRSPGEAAFDPGRPDADRVWQTTWQATMIDPVRLAAVPLQPLALHAELPPAYAATLDGEGVVTALCALVTRSGWHWQPRLGRV
jgi:hypothetical protein